MANPPAPVKAFLTTAPEFYLWFAVRDGRQGDVAASEYYTPGGQLYAPASGPWKALEAPLFVLSTGQFNAQLPFGGGIPPILGRAGFPDAPCGNLRRTACGERLLPGGGQI